VTVAAVRLRGHVAANFPLAWLGAFRTELHACRTRRADALVELGDALLCAQAFPSLPHLSLEPALPARLGQRLRRAGQWSHRGRAAA
jgi:hypothetical protein